MSKENVELHRRLVAPFNRHDIEAFIACLDPSVEYHSVMTVPGGAVYHGHDGVRKYFGDFKDAWGDEFRVEPEAFFDLGEQTLLFYVLHGRGRQSGGLRHRHPQAARLPHYRHRVGRCCGRCRRWRTPTLHAARR